MLLSVVCNRTLDKCCTVCLDLEKAAMLLCSQCHSVRGIGCDCVAPGVSLSLLQLFDSKIYIFLFTQSHGVLFSSRSNPRSALSLLELSS